MKEAKEGGKGKYRDRGEGDIARTDFVTPAVIRTTLLVRSMSSFSCSLVLFRFLSCPPFLSVPRASSLAHSHTFLSVLLLPSRRPDALGIRVSSSPSASLCRRSFFLRLSLLVPSLSFFLAPLSVAPVVMLSLFLRLVRLLVDCIRLCSLASSRFLSFSLPPCRSRRGSLCDLSLFPSCVAALSWSLFHPPTQNYAPPSPTLPPLPRLDTVRARSPPATLQWDRRVHGSRARSGCHISVDGNKRTTRVAI